ncbi:MAG: hypothetical protein WDN04_13850 [Rhodospirillales bacterium]
MGLDTPDLYKALQSWAAGKDELRKGIATALLDQANNLVGQAVQAAAKTQPAGVPDPAVMHQARKLAKAQIDAHMRLFTRVAGRIAHHSARLAAEVAEHKAREPKPEMGKRAPVGAFAAPAPEPELGKGIGLAAIGGFLGGKVGALAGGYAGLGQAGRRAASRGAGSIIAHSIDHPESIQAAATGTKIGRIAGGAVGVVGGLSVGRRALSDKQRKQRLAASQASAARRGRAAAPAVIAKAAPGPDDDVLGPEAPDPLAKGALNKTPPGFDAVQARIAARTPPTGARLLRVGGR